MSEEAMEQNENPTCGILIVDPQYDFFPGGTLAVPDADQIIEPINRLVAIKAGCPVFVSQDWHPEETVHFAAQGGAWPAHCVQATRGAEIHEDLIVDPVELVRKGTDPKNDAGYSAFEGKGPGGELLVDLLRSHGINTLIVCGLATDYCVHASVLDALKEGFTVQLYADGIRAVNLDPKDGLEAIAEMMEAGATMLYQEDLIDLQEENEDT